MINNVVITGKILNELVMILSKSGKKNLLRFKLEVERERMKPEEKRVNDIIDCQASNEIAQNIFKKFKKNDFIGIMGTINSNCFEGLDGKIKKSVYVSVCRGQTLTKGEF